MKVSEDPPRGHTAFLGLRRRILHRAITHPRMPHSPYASPTTQTNAGLLPRNTPSKSQAESQAAWLTSSASLSTISRTFNSLSKVLFIFPSRYLFAIGHMLVFSLRGWAPYLHSKFLVFTATCTHNIFSFVYKTFTFFGSFSQMILLVNIFLTGLGCFLFARRYLENRVFFLFLLLLRCFSSQGLTS